MTDDLANEPANSPSPCARESGWGEGHHDHDPPDPPHPPPSPAAKAALAIIGGYKRAISPFMPPACRFVPTCSEYGYEAIAKYGIIRGGRLAVWRVLRCNPFGASGYDPVP
jgi:uncharacterized protein